MEIYFPQCSDHVLTVSFLVLYFSVAFFYIFYILNRFFPKYGLFLDRLDTAVYLNYSNGFGSILPFSLVFYTAS